MVNERYGVAEHEVDIERRRLAFLAEARDPRTFRLLSELGIGPGGRVWELGAGAGTVATWMASQVGPGGSVWSTDIDVRYHGTAAPNVTVQQHDVVHEQVPVGEFDLVHARAVLQHIAERDEVLARLVASLKPGGVILIEESDFQAFAAQKLPEPLAAVQRIINSAQPVWREANYGNRVAYELRELGCVDVETVGDCWSMHPHVASGEWWFLAVERIGPRLIAAGAITQPTFDAAMAQLRAPGFTMMGPLSLAIHGRKPA